MTIQIEEGKFYRDERGVKRGPMQGRMFKWERGFGGTRDPEWDNSGVAQIGSTDLVAEWIEEPPVTPPVRVQILNEGAALTNGHRNVDYGPPSANLACAGELKAILRKYLARDIAPGEMEAIDQVCTKLGRVVTGSKPKRDTYVDGATYFAIAGEIALAGLDGLS